MRGMHGSHLPWAAGCSGTSPHLSSGRSHFKCFAGPDTYPLIMDVVNALVPAANFPGVPQLLQQSVGLQAALVRLAAGGLTATLQQQQPHLDDAAWRQDFDAYLMVFSLPLHGGLLAHEQQTDGALLRLALQSQEPLFAALAALGPPGSLPPCNPVMDLINNIGLAGEALHAAVESGRPWERLAPVLPQLLSFLRGLHSLVSLAAEAVPSDGQPPQQRRSTEHFAGSQGQQAAAAASHSSHGLAIWSDTHTSNI